MRVLVATNSTYDQNTIELYYVENGDLIFDGKLTINAKTDDYVPLIVSLNAAQYMKNSKVI